MANHHMKLPIPPVPKTQTLPKEFGPPPVDGSLSLPEMYDWHYEHSPTHPLFVYTDDDDLGSERAILWPEAIRAIHRAGWLFQEMIREGEGNGNLSRGTVVAILAAADTITYFTIIMGLLRSGIIVFPISTRNSPAAIAHLLQKTQAGHLLIGKEPAIMELAEASLRLVSDMKPITHSFPNFEEIYTRDGDFQTSDWKLPFHRPSMDSPAIILHSSGTTAFPKPIYWTHYGLVQHAGIPFFGEQDIGGIRLALHSVPVYHAMGGVALCWPASMGITVTSFKPRQPAIIPTPETLIKEVMSTKSDMVFCVPSFIEAWANNETYVDHLQRMRGLLFGGAPLSKLVGNVLSSRGVNLFSTFGCTEGVMCSRFIPKRDCEDWEYFELSPCMKSKLLPDADGHYELVILPADHMLPFVFNTKIDGVDAYATGDLLIQHPTKPWLYRVHGRTDDQVVHSTGEKTNPVPLEAILNRDPHVQSSVIFGRQRFHAGVLVDPVVELRLDPHNDAALSEFRNKIWPSVEKMNNHAPQHSRIFKEMIIVSKASKPFTYTAKNNARRQAIINEYEQEIEDAYRKVAESAQTEMSIPLVWSNEESLDFVRNVIRNVMHKPIGDDDDIFIHGCDSLQGTWIRNTILHALRKSISTPTRTRSIPMNFVYDHPSIAALANYITSLEELNGFEASESTTSRMEDMVKMAVKYSEQFATHIPRAPALAGESPNKMVVTLTGSTGGLGSVLLSKFLTRDDVTRVFAINRSDVSQASLKDRQERALSERGLDVSILSSSKLVLLEGDLSAEYLGLFHDVYNEIRNTTTHIIHNAYPVNFNLSCISFEPSIQGLRRLIDLALASSLNTAPRLLFISSAAVIRNRIAGGEVEEKFVEPNCAVGSGYGESKWVCERVLQLAEARTALRPIIVRVGQLSGVSTNGFWTTKEWVPSLLKSSVNVGCLPVLDGRISWLPGDIAAQIIVEMVDSTSNVLHIAHPSPVEWSGIFAHASRALALDLVPFAAWLDKVQKNGGKPGTEVPRDAHMKNPALRLVPFFQEILHATKKLDEGDKYGLDALGMTVPLLSRAKEVSKTLRENCAPLTGADVEKWLRALQLTA